jgi:hypothetical protein
VHATQPANISIVLRNLLLWPLLAFAIGLPINSLAPFAALLLGTLILLLARPKSSHSRWIAAGCLAIVGGGSALLEPPAIEEGMNAFVPGYPQSTALQQDLPEPFYKKSVKLFAKTYPHPCNPETLDLPYVRGLGSGNQAARYTAAYAFSSDGLWTGAKYSRRTPSVDFHNIAELRAGFVNDIAYYWYRRCEDLRRTRMPFVVRYDLPTPFGGSELCWTGMVMLQDRQGLHDLSSSAPLCRTLEFEAGPPAIFGVAVKGVDLALKIVPPTWLRAWHIGLEAARVGATLLVLLIFLKPRYVPLALAVAATIASLILIDRYEPEQHVYRYPFGQSVDVRAPLLSAPNFETYRVLPGDMDGFRHAAFARAILWQAAHREFKEAVRGGENVYLYMPGMRYLEAVALAIFGESEFGPIFFASLTAIVLFYFIATFTNAATALVVCAAFLLGPKLLTQPFLLDFDIWLHVYLGHWSDATAALAMMMASAILLRLLEGRVVPTFAALAVPGLLVSIAVFLRANYALVGIAAMVCGLRGLRRSLPPSRLAVVAAGFVFMGTAALHNLAFSGKWVPFTTNIQENISAPPAYWLKALGGVLGIETDGGHARAAIVHQLNLWFFDEQTSLAFVLFRGVALALLLAFALVRTPRTEGNVMLLAIVVAAQLPLPFFLNTGRYGLLAWPCTLIAVVPVLRAATTHALDWSRRWRSTRAAPNR